MVKYLLGLKGTIRVPFPYSCRSAMTKDRKTDVSAGNQSGSSSSSAQNAKQPKTNGAPKTPWCVPFLRLYSVPSNSPDQAAVTGVPGTGNGPLWSVRMDGILR